MSRKRSGMGPCPCAIRSGGPCPNNGHVSDGYLCHVHRGMEEVRFYSPEKDRTPPASKPDVTVEMLRFWKRNVRCEYVSADGRQCARIGRALYMFVDGKIRCQSHGGGRNGRSQVEALREVLGVR